MDYTRADIDAKFKAVNEKSVFDLPILNTLGLDNMSAKAELKAYALQNPVEYTKVRSEIYKKVVSNIVLTSYKSIWKLLKQGLTTNPADGQDEKLFPDTSDLKDWTPQLQDAEVGRLATGYAESMLNLFEDIFEKILPSDYKQLAEDKLTSMAKLDIITKT